MTILPENMDFHRVYIIGLVLLLIISWVLTTRAEETSSTCEEDLAATGQYVLILKEQRDKLEVEVARLRYWKDFLERQNKQIEAKLIDQGNKGGKK